MNIDQLNAALRGGVTITEDLEFSPLALSRDTDISSIACLQSDVSESLANVQLVLNKAVPDDFDYELDLSGERPTFGLIYEDGPTAGGFYAVSYTASEQFLESLRQRDWDEDRARMINGSNIFDDMVKASEGMPSAMPSLQFLESKYSEEIEKFKADVFSKRGFTDILFISEDGQEDDVWNIIREEHERSVDLQGLFINALACTTYPAIVCIDGKPMSSERLQEVVESALNCLGPISRAKAERRF